MNSNSEMERTTDLKDLLYRTLKQWRKIVAGAIIIALIAALYQVYSGLRTLLDEEAFAKAQEKHAIAMDDYEAKGERLRASIANLRTKSADQQEYNSKSELMKIDPMNEWAGNFQCYIDSRYQIDPTLTYQTPDLTNRLVAAYMSYLRSGELYMDIMNEVGTVNEIRFLKEIYSVVSDAGTATITVSCIGKSEADVHMLLDYVKQKIAERYETIQNTIGEHSYSILTESVYSMIDVSLDATQKANLLSISEYANAIGEQSAALTEWENTQPPKQEFGAWYTTKQAIKAIILGGIIGVIFLFCWYAGKYIVTNTVKTEADWKRYGIPVLGHIGKDQKKQAFQWIDRLIDRVFGQEHSATMQQSCILVANTLSAMMQSQQYKDNEMCFVGSVDRPFAEEIARTMADAAAVVKFRFAGNPLTEPDTFKKLEAADSVVLLAENRVTTLSAIDQLLTILKAWGQPVSGVVTVD